MQRMAPTAPAVNPCPEDTIVVIVDDMTILARRARLVDLAANGFRELRLGGSDLVDALVLGAREVADRAGELRDRLTSHLSGAR